jgi:RNA polymerase sigma factor (sigma-70 family)
MTIRRDTELVQMACSGDKRAFEELIGRHQQMVNRLAARMVTDQAVAQDLAQEALLQAYLCLQDLRNPGSFQSWLYGIVLNLCRRYRQSRHEDYLSFDALTGGLHFDAMLFTSGAPGPQEIVETQELHALVTQAINDLSPKNRAAVVLFYYEQLNVREISALLGISVAAVKGRLYKSREQLREQLTLAYPHIHPLASAHERKARMIEVRVFDVVKQEDSGHHVVVLLDEQGGRIIPIWIGPFEAENIALNLLGQETGRPLTYRFTANLLAAANITLEEVRVEALRANTFYAIAKLLSHGQVAEIDARPSDAIALAQHMGSPIYVHEEVMASAGMEAPEQFRKQTKPKGLQAVAEELAQKMREWEASRNSATEHPAEQHEQARRALLDYLAGEQS